MDEPLLEKRVLELFETMLELPEAKQRRWLDEQTQGDKKLRARLTAVWRADQTIKLQTGSAGLGLDCRPPPETVGAYRIINEIGAGGMGTVYLAERSSGDFEHRVAIKLIKPGLFTSALVESFESERRVLAKLNHPHIARLYDGGLNEDGDPFIVMEFVDGVPLFDWIEARQPSLEVRLGLMRQVCDAVGYAHQNLVIHRDLTPSNILVTQQNHAKLIDFGISRETDVVQEPSQNTAAPNLITPEYAAPEHAGRQETSTLSDVYSLGKILKALVGEFAEPELGAIIDKATQEAPSDRFGSVAEFHRDIENFRERRPVSAHSQSTSYALRKLVSRQRVAFGGAVLGLVALCAGATAAFTGLEEAKTARLEAETRLSETQSMASLLMFDVFDEVRDAPGTTDARLMIAQNAQAFLDSIAQSDPSASAQLLAGRGYLRLAEVTGGFAPGNAGELLTGIDHLERAEALLEPLLDKAVNDEIRLAYAKTQIALMRSKGQSYIDVEGAAEHGERALQVLDTAQVNSAEIVAARGEAARYHGDFLACCLNEAARGLETIEQGYERIVAEPANTRQAAIVRRAENDLLNLKAGFAIFTGGFADGVPVFKVALAAQSELAQETGLAEDLDLEAVIAGNLVRTLLELDKPAEAADILTPVFTRVKLALARDPKDNRLMRTIATLSFFSAVIDGKLGARDQAMQSLKDGLQYAQKADWPGGIASLPSLIYANQLHEASQAYWALGEKKRACETMRQSLDSYARYSEVFELPETSLRYRIGPMKKRMELCPV
ncbi:MAG: serine/threonine-protein kinase [Pseudomonadota bacterium]